MQAHHHAHQRKKVPRTTSYSIDTGYTHGVPASSSASIDQLANGADHLARGRGLVPRRLDRATCWHGIWPGLLPIDISGDLKEPTTVRGAVR